MTPEELKQKHPDLFEQLKEKGREAARQEIQAKIDKIKASKDQAVKQAVKQAEENVLLWVDHLFGADARQKMQMVFDSGLTVEQLKAGKKFFSRTSNDATATAGQAARQQVLNGLNRAVLDSLATEGKGFAEIVSAFVEKTSCKRSTAIETVAAAFPEKYQDWLAAQQK